MLLSFACRSQTLDLRSESVEVQPSTSVTPTPPTMSEADSGSPPVTPTATLGPLPSQPPRDAGGAGDTPVVPGPSSSDFDAGVRCGPTGRCDDGLVCDQLTGFCRSCFGRRDCLEKLCNDETGRCESCVEDAQCGTGQMCSSGVCWIVCETNYQCSQGFYCDVANEKGERGCWPCSPSPVPSPYCYRCDSDFDCAGSRVCVDNQCAEPWLAVPMSTDLSPFPSTTSGSSQPSASVPVQGAGGNSEPGTGEFDASAPRAAPL